MSINPEIIFFAATAVAICVLALIFAPRENPKHQQPRKSEAASEGPSRGELQRLAALQADSRAKAEIRVNGITWGDWLHRTIAYLQNRWPEYSYDQAKRTIIDHLDGVEFGDPDFEWSFQSAHEVAQQIVEEYGENYGANS